MLLPHVVIQFLAFIQTIFISPCNKSMGIISRILFCKIKYKFFFLYAKDLYKIAAFILFR